MLALSGKYGEHIGKDGLIADFGIHFMDIMSVAEMEYLKTLSPKVLKVISSYAAGINAFAKAFPEEVYVKDLFPVGPEDVIAGYMLGLVEISGAGTDLQKIMNGEIIGNIKITGNFYGIIACKINRYITLIVCAELNRSSILI